MLLSPLRGTSFRRAGFFDQLANLIVSSVVLAHCMTFKKSPSRTPAQYRKLSAELGHLAIRLAGLAKNHRSPAGFRVFHGRPAV
jgi:hypothetical protein